MLGSSRIGRRGACSKIRFDHVGDDGARLGEIEGCNSRIHLVETLAAAQRLGLDCANLVEALLLRAVIAKKLGDLWVDRVRHIAESRALAGSRDRRQISLGSVSRPVDTMTTWSAAGLVGLDE